MHDEKLVMLCLFEVLFFYDMSSFQSSNLLLWRTHDEIRSILKWSFWKESSDCKREVTRCSDIGKHVFKEEKQGVETLAGCWNLNLKRRKQGVKTLAECRNLNLSKRNKVSKPWCGDQGVVTLICRRKQGVENMV